MKANILIATRPLARQLQADTDWFIQNKLRSNEILPTFDWYCSLTYALIVTIVKEDEQALEKMLVEQFKWYLPEKARENQADDDWRATSIQALASDEYQNTIIDRLYIYVMDVLIDNIQHFSKEKWVTSVLRTGDLLLHFAGYREHEVKQQTDINMPMANPWGLCTSAFSFIRAEAGSKNRLSVGKVLRSDRQLLEQEDIDAAGLTPGEAICVLQSKSQQEEVARVRRYGELVKSRINPNQMGLGAPAKVTDRIVGSSLAKVAKIIPSQSSIDTRTITCYAGYVKDTSDKLWAFDSKTQNSNAAKREKKSKKLMIGPPAQGDNSAARLSLIEKFLKNHSDIHFVELPISDERIIWSNSVNISQGD